MNKKILTKISSSLLILGMTLVLLVSTSLPTYAEAKYEADYIKKLDSVVNDYEQYLNSSVVFKLPSAVKDTDDLSLIIKLDDKPLLDLYEASDKKMTIAEFSQTEEAKALRVGIAALKGENISEEA